MTVILDDINNKSYIPNNILITGGSGFIGSHLTIYLCKKYLNTAIKIVVIDKLDYCANINNLEPVKSLKNYRFYHGSILDQSLVNRILELESIDTIIHLAAYTHVDHSFEDSIKFTENNVLGTHILVEACRKYNRIKRFIYVSTDEVYGSQNHNNNQHPLNNNSNHQNNKSSERSLLQPTNPYSASKAGAELIVQSYARSFNLPVIITRGNNAYGPRQYPEKIIPKFISLILNNKPCTIHGNGNNLRSFLYIDDVVDAFNIILHHGEIGEIYNIATEFEISNIQVAKTLIEMIKKDDDNTSSSKYIEYIEDRPFNDTRYHLNCTKLKQLGWRPKIDWKIGLNQTLNWYIDNLNYWNNNNNQNNNQNNNNNGISCKIGSSLIEEDEEMIK